MRYLSFDIEATGLEEDAYIIEFGMIPFDTEDMTLREDLQKHFYIKCPSYQELEPNLNEWVKQHNKELIDKASQDGISIDNFKKQLESYLESDNIKNYFGSKQIHLFGKSISAIDLPFLNRDLGWEWMNKYFHHRNLDLSCATLTLIDLDLLPQGLESGTEMMKYLEMGDVCHTALEDAIHTAEMYLKILKKINHK